MPELHKITYLGCCQDDSESRMDGKSREAVEINGRLENLLLSIQSAYLSLIAKGQPFDATDVKELFQGSVQARCRLIERLDMFIREKESHMGIDIKEVHLFRKYICRELQRPIPVREKIFLYGSGSIN